MPPTYLGLPRSLFCQPEHWRLLELPLCFVNPLSAGMLNDFVMFPASSPASALECSSHPPVARPEGHTQHRAFQIGLFDGMCLYRLLSHPGFWNLFQKRAQGGERRLGFWSGKLRLKILTSPLVTLSFRSKVAHPFLETSMIFSLRWKLYEQTPVHGVVWRLGEIAPVNVNSFIYSFHTSLWGIAYTPGPV